MRQITLRRLLLVSLVAFAVLPSLVVIVLSFQQSYAAVSTLTQRMLDDAAIRIQNETLEHLRRPNAVINALIEPDKTSEQAQNLFADPLEFERIAFALTRQYADVPYLYFATGQGEFLGVQRQATGTRVGVRSATDIGRSNYMAASPGDRSNLVSKETQAYEPRTRPWFGLAERSLERSYTEVYASSSTQRLLVTLAQPVLDKSGAVMAVVGADLALDYLSDTLQRGKISENAVAYIVDDKGNLVATSTTEKLFRVNIDILQRISPLDSSDMLMAQSFLKLAGQMGLQNVVTEHLAAGKAIAFGDPREMVSITQPVGKTLNLKWTLVVAAPRSDFAQDVTSGMNRLLLVVSVLLALAGLLAWWFASALSGRLYHLRAAAKLLGSGEIPPVNDKSRIYDVTLLSRAMHNSGVQLQASRADIEAKARALMLANETLEERVAERTAELVASREEALAAAHAKASFLATMSHEIRTPLNGVVGMTALMADTQLDLEQRDYLHTMRVSSDQLLGVINDILDFSKIESGKLELEAEPLNLQNTIEEACDIAASRAREKGLELLVDVDGDVPEWVSGDVTRLRQVLLNLINNAIKFTSQGQVVVSSHLRADPAGAIDAPKLIEFRVKDTGVGIPLASQAALFQSFSQVDASTTRKYGGTGLGLAICKRLASLMGGEVGVQSAPGEGSEFWFSARLATIATPDKTHEVFLQTGSLANKVALVVDDTLLNLRILDRQLSRWGMRSVRFERAQPALDWLASCAPDALPDVIITDMHMPEMDGLTFIQTVRKQLPDAHVVLLTSGLMPTGLEARVFDARLLKPYRQSQLFNALGRVSTMQAGVGSLQALGHSAGQSLNQAPVRLLQRILVADDNAINLKVALAILTKLGYSATTALDGQEAADKVMQSLSSQPGAEPYAAVLMDANMPVMDGLKATRLIQLTHGSAAPPIIALTASVLEEDRQRCLDAGMQGFLAKPLRIDELNEALAQFAVRNPIAIKTGAASAHITNATALKDTEKAPVLMNWARLEQFREFDDDALGMTREIISLFIKDTPERFAALHTALASNSSAALSQAAHALKGSASNIGASAIEDACARLEQSCLQGAWPVDAASQVERACARCGPTLAALQNWLERSR